jgi:multicomponent Na+:H+ antiporter subunit G
MLLGMVLLAIAAVGVLRLPDALSRQHASTKAATLALGVLLIGVAIKGGGLAWALRALGIFVALLVTLPAASHLLARAALRERERGPVSPESGRGGGR